MYKATRLSTVTDLVVERKLVLYRDRLQTCHNVERERKTWQLDRKCRLDPEDARDIARQRRLIRPPSMWSARAAATGSGQPIDLVRALVRA